MFCDASSIIFAYLETLSVNSHLLLATLVDGESIEIEVLLLTIWLGELQEMITELEDVAELEDVTDD